MDLITINIHTTCNTQPFEAPTIIIFTEFSIGLTSLYRHIMRERERERERFTPSTYVHVLYCPETQVVGKCYKTKTYIKKLGIVINTYYSRKKNSEDKEEGYQ